jgi:hypothetical protein
MHCLARLCWCVRGRTLRHRVAPCTTLNRAAGQLHMSHMLQTGSTHSTASSINQQLAAADLCLRDLNLASVNLQAAAAAAAAAIGSAAGTATQPLVSTSMHFQQLCLPLSHIRIMPVLQGMPSLPSIISRCHQRGDPAVYVMSCHIMLWRALATPRSIMWHSTQDLQFDRAVRMTSILLLNNQLPGRATCACLHHTPGATPTPTITHHTGTWLLQLPGLEQTHHGCQGCGAAAQVKYPEQVPPANRSPPPLM